MIKYDSNRYTLCEGCFEPIAPDERKIVIGTEDGDLEVYCGACAWQDFD